MKRNLFIGLLFVVFCLYTALAAAEVTLSWGFPIKGNWWQLTNFGFGGYNSAFASYHLGVDTKVGKLAYGTEVYAPCSGEVKISDNKKFSGYGADSSQNPNYYGYTVVIECLDDAGQYFSVLLGHVQPGSENYNPSIKQGLAPLGKFVYKGQYVARLNNYYHGAGTSTNWIHLHFGVRKGKFDPSNAVTGYTSLGWNSEHTEHQTWVEPTQHILARSMKSTWHPDGTLIQQYGDSDIHLLIDQQMNNIYDEAAFNAHGFDWNKVVFISDDEYHCLAKGDFQIQWEPYRQVFHHEDEYYLLEKGCANCSNCTLYKFSSVSALISWGQTLAASREISDTEMNDWMNYCDYGETLYLREGTLVKPTFAVPGYGAGVIFVAQKNGVLSPFLSAQAFWRLGYDYASLLKVTESDFFASFTAYGKGISEEMVLSCGQIFDLEDETIANLPSECSEGAETEIYSGATSTKNVGECQSQIQECSDGQWLVVQEEKLPTTEILDDLDNDCDGLTDEELNPIPSVDKDDDGYTVEEGDCDDNNPYVQPDAEEICDDLDNDCNGEIDENLYQYCETNCGSGESQCDFGQWSVCDVEDFNDEICDGTDNDCDGLIDEGVKNACGGCGAVGIEICDGVDNDCDGLTDEGVKNACGGCGAVGIEICDGVDNDCDGLTDEGVKNACGGCGAVGAEICDGVDNDCDGLTDEGVNNACGKCGAVPFEICDGQDNDCDNQIDEDCPIDQPADFISCSIICPENMLAYAWWGSFGTANSWNSLSLEIPKSELCQRGQPWVDYNCTKLGWTYFDPLLAIIDCDHQFTSGLGTIDFGGEGEIWFTDFSCGS